VDDGPSLVSGEQGGDPVEQSRAGLLKIDAGIGKAKRDQRSGLANWCEEEYVWCPKCVTRSPKMMMLV
jgi:hypothetical protein